MNKGPTGRPEPGYRATQKSMKNRGSIAVTELSGQKKGAVWELFQTAPRLLVQYLC
jgi:hypothetical protein